MCWKKSIYSVSFFIGGDLAALKLFFKIVRISVVAALFAAVGGVGYFFFYPKYAQWRMLEEQRVLLGKEILYRRENDLQVPKEGVELSSTHYKSVILPVEISGQPSSW